MTAAQSGHLRLFVALRTPPAVRLEIVSLMDKLKKTGGDVQWEPPEKLHATIKFLGKTDGSIVSLISGGLRDLCAAHQPIRVSFRDTGCFPDMRQPRIVWIGIADPEDTLSQLQKSVETMSARFGFPREDRPYHPHITLGRVRSQRGMKDLLAKLESITFQSDPVTLSGVDLMRSELRPGGSVYFSMESFSFAAPEGT